MESNERGVCDGIYKKNLDDDVCFMVSNKENSWLLLSFSWWYSASQKFLKQSPMMSYL